MKTQFDNSVRIVSLENLRAMCEKVSGICHRYEIESVSANRVKVSYSNPDEYGHSSPMVASFPCYPCDDTDKEQRAVILEILRVTGDNWGGEGWQAFHPLLDCPELSRGPDGWTEYEYVVTAGIIGEVYRGTCRSDARQAFDMFNILSIQGRIAGVVECTANGKPYLKGNG